MTRVGLSPTGSYFSSSKTKYGQNLLKSTNWDRLKERMWTEIDALPVVSINSSGLEGDLVVGDADLLVAASVFFKVFQKNVQFSKTSLK